MTSNPHLLATRSVTTPALILSLFVVTSLPGCGVLPGTGGKDGDPPWILAMGANVSPGVPSIQNPGVGMTGGGSVGEMLKIKLRLIISEKIINGLLI
nr:hypothetical protein [Leptospira interrogans]